MRVASRADGAGSTSFTGGAVSSEQPPGIKSPNAISTPERIRLRLLPSTSMLRTIVRSAVVKQLVVLRAEPPDLLAPHLLGRDPLGLR